MRRDAPPRAQGSAVARNAAALPEISFATAGSQRGRRRAAAAEPPLAPHLETPLIGRSGEFTRLSRALDATAGDGGCLIAVLGEAGIGKSRLIEEVVVTARERGIETLLGHSYDTEQYLPFRAMERGAVAACRQG